MLENEMLPGKEMAPNDGSGDRPVADLPELVQRLADRVVRDADELAARIKKAAEAEAAQLIADANRRAEEIMYRSRKEADAAADDRKKAAMALQEAKQRAIAMEAETTMEVTQLKLKVKEDIDRHLGEVVGKVQNELRPSLDYLVKRAKTLEDEVRASLAGQEQPQPQIQTQAAPPASQEMAPQPDLCKTVNAAALEQTAPRHEARGVAKELHSRLSEAIGKVEAPEPQPAPREPVAAHTVVVKAAPKGQAQPAQNSRQLVEGRAEIHIAPPISIARLLAMTRYLENAQNIKLLQTSGSWSLGSVITIQAEKPVPLLDILKTVPHVHEVTLADNGASGDKGAPRKILVTLTGGEAQTNKTLVDRSGR